MKKRIRKLVGVFTEALCPGYPLWIRLLEIFALLIFSVMSLYLLISSVLWVVDTYSNAKVVAVIGLVIFSFFVADFISGFVHFACDNFGREDTKIIGPIFIRHFLAHHDDPEDITQHDFIETNGNNFLACSLLLAPCFILNICFGVDYVGLLNVFWLFLSGFLAMTNQSHKLAHQRSVGPVIRCLQKVGFLLSQKDHALHHRPPYNKNYCITSGALNRPLARINFFSHLEVLLRRVLFAKS